MLAAVCDACVSESALETHRFAERYCPLRPTRSVDRTSNACLQQQHRPHHPRVRHPERVAPRRAPVVPCSTHTRHELPRALPVAADAPVREILHPGIERRPLDVRPGPAFPSSEIHLGESRVDDGRRQVRPNGSDFLRQCGATLQRRAGDADAGRKRRRRRLRDGPCRRAGAGQIGTAIAKPRFSQHRRMPQQPERAHPFTMRPRVRGRSRVRSAAAWRRARRR